ncbi:unnamed protein product [Vicia faba]|uniref:Uncharacterized protein n=1 Tax=Vicia faba TaxID=3906 RepID=A0AAV0ZB08_VICFA|nr:unnamed protein product [Vicia faba]
MKAKVSNCLGNGMSSGNTISISKIVSTNRDSNISFASQLNLYTEPGTLKLAPTSSSGKQANNECRRQDMESATKCARTRYYGTCVLITNIVSKHHTRVNVVRNLRPYVADYAALTLNFPPRKVPHRTRRMSRVSHTGSATPSQNIE